MIKECCWCGKYIDENSPLYALGAKVKPEVDLSKYEGRAMPLGALIHERHLYAIVPSFDSDAKKAGQDLLLVTCSKNCGNELKASLEREKLLGDILESLDRF
jgi:hypothetical protein